MAGRGGKGDKATVATGDVARLNEQLNAVRDIGEALAESFGLDDLFKRIVPHVSRLMGAERSTLFLHSPESNEIWSKVAEGERGREIRLPVGTGLAGWVAANRKMLRIDNAYQDERFNADIDARTGYRTRSVLTVPLVDRQGDLQGVLQVLNPKDGGPFTDEHVGLLNTIAVQVVYAVENAHQAEEIIIKNRELEAARNRAERRRAELDLLYLLEQEATAADELVGLIDTFVTRTAERLRSFAAGIFLLGENDSELLLRSVDDAALRSLAPDACSVARWVADHGEAAVLNRPGDDTRHDGKLDALLQQPMRAMLTVPLVWDHQLIGAMLVVNPRTRDTGAVGYDDEDVKVLTLIAGQVARAVSLKREREQRNRDERLAYLGRMLAAVAHDLRNPMTVISGYAQLMAIEDSEEERAKRCDRILSQVDEMTAMITDLLAFARGDTELRLQTMQLARFGDELREFWLKQCETRLIELQVAAPETTVVVDPGRVKRIVHNLAKNAMEAMPKGGRLELALSVDDGALAIRVSDTGFGIPEEVRRKLFKAFTTEGKQGGTGLGLSIVKRFVDDHRGSIDVDSVPDQGTTFNVRLPLYTNREAYQ